MFLLALNKLNLLPAECIMVGDNARTDIEGANAVGLDTVIIAKNKPTRVKGYQRPNHHIKKIDELLDIL